MTSVCGKSSPLKSKRFRPSPSPRRRRKQSPKFKLPGAVAFAEVAIRLTRNVAPALRLPAPDYHLRLAQQIVKAADLPAGSRLPFDDGCRLARSRRPRGDARIAASIASSEPRRFRLSAQDRDDQPTCREESSWKSLLVVEQITVINGSERLFEASGAVSCRSRSRRPARPDRGCRTRSRRSRSSFCDCLRHIFARQRSKLLGQLVGLFILYV